LNPSNLSQVLSDTWSDYDGDEIYGDYTLSGSTATNQRSFQPGIATVDTWTGSGGANTKYYHADLIGTTRSMSLSTGLPDATAATVYTAFGERLSTANPRYGFAGAWQYQAHSFPATPIPYLHVGHRYYDPTSGRFLQRDPISIRGGVNEYVYTFNRPTVLIDPMGFSAFGDSVEAWGDAGMGVGVICIFVGGVTGAVAPNPVSGGLIIVGAAAGTAGIVSKILGIIINWFS